MTLKATLSEAMQSAIDEFQLTLNTAIPGYVLKFDAATQQAEIQIGIVRKTKTGDTATPTPIIKCPVSFSGGAKI